MSKPNNDRIPLPRDPEGIIELALAILFKHEEMGEASPLRVLEMGEFKRVATRANTEHKKCTEYRKRGRHCREVRDGVVGVHGVLTAGTLRQFVASAREVLAGLYKTQERALSEWGFEVLGGSRSTSEPPQDGQDRPPANVK